MPLQSRINQYFGINAHLQSYYQARGGSPAFHDNHITHLQEMLGETLRPFGYLVDNATSLQVREFKPHQPPIEYSEQADLGLRDYEARAKSNPRPPQVESGHVLVLSIPAAVGLSEKKLLRALAIREIDLEDGRLGRMVGWLEVLSPSNKPGGQDWLDYQGKRLALIKAGLTLVELDYLHKQPPVIAGLPVYRTNPRQKRVADPDANPYYIAVTDPRPTLYAGQTTVYPFAIDEPVPLVQIPLSRGEAYPFDFGLAYNRTFSLDAHALLVDYELLPHEFTTYNQRDRNQIRRRMEIIAEHRHELGNGPFLLDSPGNGIS